MRSRGFPHLPWHLSTVRRQVIIKSLIACFRKDPGYEDHRITFRLWHETELFPFATHRLILNCVEALLGPGVALWVVRVLSTEPTTTQDPLSGIGTRPTAP